MNKEHISVVKERIEPRPATIAGLQIGKKQGGAGVSASPRLVNGVLSGYDLCLRPRALRAIIHHYMAEQGESRFRVLLT
jgi:hypothetical protein